MENVKINKLEVDLWEKLFILLEEQEVEKAPLQKKKPYPLDKK